MALTSILWLIAGPLFLSMCLPPLFHLLGWSRYFMEQDDAAIAAESGDDDAYTAKLLSQLRELGFKPLGAVTETVHFFILHWSWSCRQRIFGSKERRAFAALYRFVKEEPVRLAFVTCFADGAMAWTGNHSEDIRMLSADFVRWGFATDDLAELLERHHQAADRLAGSDRKPVDHDQLANLAAVLAPHSRRQVFSSKAEPRMFLVASLFLGGVAPAIVAASFGFDSWFVPLVVIVEAILYWGVHIRHLLGLIARDRQAEVRR